MKILRDLPPQRRQLIGQVVRYGLTGGFVTAVQAAIYWSFATLAGLHPQIANLIGYVAAVALGYVLHGAFTFRGHGSGDGHARRGARFFAVSLLSLALNALWVWLCTDALGWPTWTPIPFMAAVTPGIVFTLNRIWVFR